MTPAQPPAAPRRPRIRRRLRTAQEARVWRKKVTGYALFIGAFVLMVNAFVGENGYLAAMRNASEQRALLRELASLRTESQQMQREIHSLRSDDRALEELARRQQGLKRPGEFTIILKDAQPARTPPVPREK